MAGIPWSKIIEALPNVAMALLPGAELGAGAIRGGRAIRGIASGITGGAFSYPPMTSDFVVADPMEFGGTITSVDGKETVLPAMNGNSMDRSTLNAVLAQSLEQHNRATLDGTEHFLNEWWPGEDTKPRQVISPKSTAVKGIKIRKDGEIQVQFRDGSKWYTYRGGDNIRESTEKVKDLLTMPSIGRALARKAKHVWKDSKHLLPNSESPANPGVDGQWGRANYEHDTSKWGG